MKTSTTLFDIEDFILDKQIQGQNLKSESSIQDCLILRKRYEANIERCWISNKFKCKCCGRQLSIIDLFSSEDMNHSPEFIKNALNSDSEDFKVINGNPKREVKITCDCGNSDYYKIPEFAIKASTGTVFAYLRECRFCY